MEKDIHLAIIKEDPWLVPYKEEILQRFVRFQRALLEIELAEDSLMDFATGHHFFGINKDVERNGWVYREWAPAAQALFLIGDFNQWDRSSHPLERKEWGVWEIFLSAAEYSQSFVHQSLIKVHVVAADSALDRIPAYITRVVQDEESKDFSGQLWFPETEFEWTDKKFSPKKALSAPLVYECHVGMGQEKMGLGTYREFADLIVPKIKKNGYTAIQLMAVMEHPYYGSFGYHV
ncbi:MAG TPA: hypothetical protein VK957_01020, partial [Lunatimonas sp.]|nr:hypothetical protein [Lunatimonas sp.]